MAVVFATRFPLHHLRGLYFGSTGMVCWAGAFTVKQDAALKTKKAAQIKTLIALTAVMWHLSVLLP